MRFGIEAREKRAQMGGGHEGHVGETDQRGLGETCGCDSARQRLRYPGFGPGVDDDVEPHGRKLYRERPVGTPTYRDASSRRQLENGARGVQRQRLAVQHCQELVAFPEPLGSPGGEKDSGDFSGFDHHYRFQDKMRMIATAPADILRFMLARSAEGQASALVTLTGIEGSSPRAIGAQMAVAEDGRYVGSLSGGCVEAAVVAEALDTLKAREGRLVRFGAGSPYLDIRLPCGSGIDLLFTPHPDVAVLEDAVARLADRHPVALSLSDEGAACAAPGATGWEGSSFVNTYVPALRLIAAGQGEDLAAVSRLARAFGADVLAITPDRRIAEILAREQIAVEHLVAPTMLPAVSSDAWTAILSLFHDRDWEEVLLPAFLAIPAFYHGAVGSRRTHERRVDALVASGISRDAIGKLRGPVGLIPATRDPATLALSALSDIVGNYRRIAESETRTPEAYGLLAAF